MIKGVIFDLDGVITDTAKLHYKAWNEIVNELGIDYSEEENEKLRGLPRKDTLLAIFKLKKFKNNFDDQKINELCTKKNELYLSYLKKYLNKDSLLEGIEQFLKDLKKDKIKMAIASSSFNAPLILEKLGVINYFDVIVNPTEVKKGKPAPDIFLLAQEQLKLKKEECVGIEDAVAGVEALNIANIKSIAITNGNNNLFQKATLLVQDTSKLIWDLIKPVLF
ncbi:beta-phosphoglucomutase [Mycoplasmopsis caviae]|uniref:Beta-phosphoglucomutase n=1 Tax=Mycoplasmopsis caviae TaxID=55603 RepID=A0A3P8K8F6_9BACT|nr:beta-phosphoglucomutase [Mycoplasmopsis caviae]UUD35630.1 beta-phosphoglucomutase [Mycoplasmopsis caviae]VDR41619.1 beta-phosphoglucomutase (beta-PGM) domain-containing protein [Mycoplasmopsis caviae]